MFWFANLIVTGTFTEEEFDDRGSSAYKNDCTSLMSGTRDIFRYVWKRVRENCEWIIEIGEREEFSS